MLYLDDGNVVAESNEGNNFFSIKYTLKCKGGQGGNGKPDITDAKKGIIIGGAVGGAGGQFVPWGGFADLSGVTPLPGTIVNGRCAFNATYFEINIGGAATSPDYTNKLKVDGADAAINTARHLNAGETKSVTTQPYLNEGSHALTLSLDDGNVVAESSESNNQFSIKYTLKCNGNNPGTPTGQGKPDLVPQLANPMNGTVVVKNIGTGPAGPSKLTLDCHKEGHVGGGGGCVDPPATLAAAYHDPAFPDKVTVSIPALAPGASYSHTLTFWGVLKWPSGKYDFTGVADAANTVAESNEANNTTTSTLTVP
jgi:subtilase family serine protease